MKPGLQLFLCIVSGLYGCRFTDHKKHASFQKSATDTTAIHKEAITGQTQPYQGQYCLIKKLYTEGDTCYIEADYIQFLMGDKAVAAAKKKGDADTFTDKNGNIAYTVLDDCYILNENPAIRKLALANDVVIQLVSNEDGNAFLINSSFGKLNKNPKDAIYVLQLENGLVKKIKQQYLP
jgi:hypothetical protein